MSFILDALKKSETDRQERSSAEFAKVPTSSRPARLPTWLLILGLLLGINLLVLLGLLFKSPGAPESPLTVEVPAGQPDVEIINSQPAQAPPATEAIAVPDQQGEATFANRIAAAKRDNPTISGGGEAVPAVSDPQPVTVPPVARETSTRRRTAVPTIFEVIADGSVALPELHLDIHVYSESPEDRFVFINMSKQREKSQLREGPVVAEITPEGVILQYRGKSFLLPRD